MYQIRNKITGAYLLKSLIEPLSFHNYGDALQYLTKHNLNFKKFEIVKKGE